MKVLILINYLNNFSHSFLSFVITFYYYYGKQWLKFGLNYNILLFFPRRSHPIMIHSQIFDWAALLVSSQWNCTYVRRDIFKRHTHHGLEMYVCRAHLKFYFCHSGMRKALGYGLKSFWVEILILVTSDREVERKWLTKDERVKLFFMPLDLTSYFFLIQSYTATHVCPIQKLYASQAVMAGASVFSDCPPGPFSLVTSSSRECLKFCNTVNTWHWGVKVFIQNSF